MWEAVALSLGQEPAELPAYLGVHNLYGDDPFRICPANFRERLSVANSNCGIAFEVKLVHPLRARCIVDLPLFSKWLAGLALDMPPEMVAMVPASIAEPKAKPIDAPVTLKPLVPAITEEDTERRLKLLRLLGGSAKYSQGEWRFKGTAALVAQEKADGRNRSDEKTIRADLKEAAQAERDAKAAGFGTGLGQR